MSGAGKTGVGTPTVSVIVPTCNRAALSVRCVRALQSQTYDPDKFEIIAVDDGSTDGTLEALEALARGVVKPKQRVLANGKNIGANPSRNRGVRAAEGEVVAFLDDDCVARNDWLAHLVQAFVDPDVAVVVGLVTDPEPDNIWDLAFRGTHRVGKAGTAPRLILGNMAIRRELLLRYALDEDYAFKAAPTAAGSVDVETSGRSDEEGLYLRLRAAGHRIIANPEAAVLHEHHYTAKSFFRQAYKGGRSAARLVYKFRQPHRLDMIPFMCTYGALGASLVNPFLLPLVPLFFGGAMAAITYNDLFRKGKTPRETALSFPALVAYYHVRFYGYARQTAALHLKKSDLERVRP
jgi:GT2 family glycosyltransferase